MDPLAEKYNAWSTYAYCNNNPIEAIDSDGKLYGFHNGSRGEKTTYWSKFDEAVMIHFGDNKPLYYDGSLGGVWALAILAIYQNVA